MRESCSCGSSVRVLFYYQLEHWRLNHRHDREPVEEPEPEKSGSHAQVEMASEKYFVANSWSNPVISASMVHERPVGFGPNGVG